MKKKVFEQIALTCIVFHFLFDALQKLIGSSRDIYKFTLNHKMQQIEVSLDNNSLLFFEFAWFVEEFANLLIITIGLIELISGIMFFICEEEDSRKLYVYILTLLLAFDTFVVHYPFTERWAHMGKELAHFSTNIGLAGGLWMLLGFREYA